MPNQRQLQIAYLSLCRLVVHVLFDVPSKKQYLPAITDDIVPFPDQIVPVRLEVRARVGIADLTLPVNREVRSANILRVIRTQMFNPTMDQLKRLCEMRMILP